MANQDSDRPAPPAKLPALRKIGGTKTLPPIAPPPRRSLPSISAIEPCGVGVQTTPPPPSARPLPTVRTPRPTPVAFASPDALAAPAIGCGGDSVSTVTPASTATPLPAGGESAAFRTLPQSPARGSVPPVVVASPRIPLETVQGTSTAASAGRAGALGAILGLALVTMFVIGARMAYRGKSIAAGAAMVAQTVAPAVRAAPPVIVPSTGTPFLAPPPPRESTGRNLATTRPSIHPMPAVGGARPPIALTAATPAKVTSPPGAQLKPIGSAVSAGSRPSEPGAEAAQVDSAAAMIPVIPPSAPIEPDPFVSAVQHDIEEDRSLRK